MNGGTHGKAISYEQIHIVVATILSELWRGRRGEVATKLVTLK